MRVLLLFFLCLVLTRQIPAASVTTDGPAVWPARGPYRTVGDPSDGIRVKLPLPVVEAVRHLVPDDPSRWGILRVEDFSGQRKRLLRITRVTKGYVSLLLDSGYWINLSVPGGVPFLNRVLERLRPADLHDRKKVERYVYRIIYLQKYGLATILTPERQRERFTEERLIDGMDIPEEYRQKLLAREPNLKQAQIDTWLEGTEKSRRVLLALFHDLELTRAKDHVMVRCNVMSYLGAVEEWTFHLWVGRLVRLEGVDVRELYKKGTFSYPLIL